MLKNSDNEVLVHTGLENKVLKKINISWLGQTTASLCWIGSVMVIGISSSGDWLQLFAASAWLIANISAISSSDS